jgi:hypothetical protein
VAFCQHELPKGGFKAVAKVVVEIAVPAVVGSCLPALRRQVGSMQFGVFDFIELPYHHPEVSAIAITTLLGLRL